MRLSGIRLSRLAGLVRGAILEPGDSELQVPGVLQPSISLAGPLNAVTSNFGTATDPATDTCFSNSALSQAGVGAGLGTTLVFLARGPWELIWHFSAAFAGTSNMSNAQQLMLLDPGSVQATLAELASDPNQVICVNGVLRVIFERDAFAIRHTIPATVAGDSVRSTASVLCRRLI